LLDDPLTALILIRDHFAGLLFALRAHPGRGRRE
jgi:hypothetical protein